MKKLLFIPRAVADILKIWKRNGSLKQKSSFTYTLVFLKWKKWTVPADEIISIPFGNIYWKGYNNEATQFLFKEIFIKEVYKIPDAVSVRHILDVGANIGFTLLYFNKNTHARITAMEPGNTAFDLLSSNAEVHQITKTETLKVAAADFDGVLFPDSHKSEKASLNETFSAEGSGSAVQCIKLSAFIATKNIDAVKMDIEGAEETVLKDCFEANVIEKVKCWFIEFHELNKITGWINKFSEKGFTAEKREDVYCFWKQA